MPTQYGVSAQTGRVDAAPLKASPVDNISCHAKIVRERAGRISVLSERLESFCLNLLGPSAEPPEPTGAEINKSPGNALQDIDDADTELARAVNRLERAVSRLN